MLGFKRQIGEANGNTENLLIFQQYIHNYIFTYFLQYFSRSGLIVATIPKSPWSRSLSFIIGLIIITQSCKSVLVSKSCSTAVPLIVIRLVSTPSALKCVLWSGMVLITALLPVWLGRVRIVFCIRWEMDGNFKYLFPLIKVNDNFSNCNTEKGSLVLMYSSLY